jgi:DNA repair protein RadC
MFPGSIGSARILALKPDRATEQSEAHKVHCHPSFVAESSHADELITQRLKEMLAQLDVNLLDHCLGGFCSVTTAVKIHQSRGFRGINREQRIQ